MKWVIAVFLSAALSRTASGAGLDCLSCHSEKGPPMKGSIHSALDCASCHAEIQQYPHPSAVSRVKCGSCHAGAVADVSAGVHARSSAQPCLNCHGNAHQILAASNSRSPTYPRNLPRTCGECHGRDQGHSPEVYSQYADSIHGAALAKDGLLVAASCASCHGAHKILRGKDGASSTHRSHIPETCGKCHGGPKSQYEAGIHGQMLAAGAGDAPVCTDCHTTHQIARMSDVGRQIKTAATCGTCHKDQYSTYGDTFHSQVSDLGYKQTARCWDCHGFHDIRPAADEKSTIAPAHLVATCGKCHPNANPGFAGYDPHADSHNGKKYPLLHAVAIFMNLLLSGVLGFFALHTILWFVRGKMPSGRA